MIKFFLKDTLKYLPAQITMGIIGFISIPILTRLFSPQDYGYYSLVMATVTVLVGLIGWLPMAISRFYPIYEQDKNVDAFYGNTIKLLFISISIIVIILSVFLIILKKQFLSNIYFLIYLGLIVFIINSFFEFFQSFLSSKREINLYSGFAIWKTVMSFLFALLLIHLFKMGIESLFIGIIISILIILPFQWKKGIGNFLFPEIKIDYSLAKKMFIYSFPLVIGNIASWILNLSDRYVLEIFRGSKEVGIYSASYNIADKSLFLLINTFGLAINPIAIRIWETEGLEKSREFTSKVTRYYLLICIPAVIGLSILSKKIVILLTGNAYIEGYKVMVFVAISGFMLGLQKRFQSGFIFYKKTGFITFVIGISGLLNIVLNLIFVPKYGYMAAAYTTLIGYSCLLLLMIILSRRFYKWDFPFLSLFKILCASSIMGVIVNFMSNILNFSLFLNLIINICLGTLIYFILLILFNELTQKEKDTLNKLLTF